MKIRLYNFLKKPNSTKRPAGTDAYTEYDCVLKDETSIINPAVLLKVAAASEPPAWNYAYIAAFNRYYFIDDISADGPHWMVSMHCDVLATYKTTIGNTDLYVLRSSYTYNGVVVDTAYPLLTSYTKNILRLETPWAHVDLEEPGAINPFVTIEKGSFILGITAIPEAGGLGSFGSIKYVALKQSQMTAFITSLMDNTIIATNGFDIADASLSLQKSIINPLQYIKSCYWIPVAYDDLQGTEIDSTLTVWTWSIPATCKLLTGPPMKYLGGNMSIAKHPLAATKGAYMNAAPYTSIELYYPPFGMINLDPMALIDITEIHTSITLDLVTGIGRMEIYTMENNILGRLIHVSKAQIGVPIQLSEIGYDYTNIGASAVGIGAEIVGSWLRGFENTGGISSAVGMIGNAANALRTRQSSVGGNGNLSDLEGIIYLTEIFYDIAAEDNSHLGRPLCGIRKPANIPGFIVVQEADVQITGTQNESDQIKTFLESGFYYE